MPGVLAVALLARLSWARLMRQPVTWIAAVLTLVLIVLSMFFGMFNFELQDRVRMLATAGVAAVAIHGVFIAAFGAAASVQEEFAQRTALPLLAGPVSRGQLLIGKALGAWLAAGRAGRADTPPPCGSRRPSSLRPPGADRPWPGFGFIDNAMRWRSVSTSITVTCTFCCTFTTSAGSLTYWSASSLM